VIEGHRVASRPSGVYPYGTLEKQRPFFKQLGLDLADCYDGTLNISIAPHTFRMDNPQYTFEAVEWTDLHPPETFSFSRCRLAYAARLIPGWVYYPHPETKLRHFQHPSMIEVLAPYIPGIEYGTGLELHLNPDEITILHPTG
jgi:hypothetical protein